MRRFAPLLLALLAGCGPGSGPVDVAVLHFDPSKDSYALGVERLSTLDDLSTLSGEAAEAVGAARFELAPLDASDQVRIQDAGHPVNAQFVKRDGAYWPIDYPSLDLATTYYNLERARAYAQARGLGDQLDRVRFYYAAQITVVGLQGIWTDNAAFVSSLRAFLLPPFNELQDIPLSMNRGVISHEYGHAIFNAVVHRGALMPDYTARWCPGDSCNDGQGWVMMGCLEEGLADTWATAVTGDVRFLERSIPQVGSSRSVDPFDRARHCTTQEKFLADVASNGLSVAYWSSRQYFYGTIWASAMWRAGQQPGTDHDRVMDALLASYGPLGDLIRADATGADFGKFVRITDTIAAGAPDDGTRRAICSTLRARLGIPDGASAVCDGVAPLPECR